MKITAIRLDRMRLPLDPSFLAAWDPVSRRHFDATLVRVQADEGMGAEIDEAAVIRWARG
jgi:D-galactarolactone cycloisomerase